MVIVSFIRHAETVSNRKHTIQGQQDGKLTHFGRKQAKRIAKRLENDLIPIIFCSDLRRCRQTANKIAKYHPEAPLVKDPRLRERAVGVLEGWPSGSTKELAAQVGDSDRSFRPEGGESLKDVRKRAKSFWKDLLSRIIPNLVNPNILPPMTSPLFYQYQESSHFDQVISSSSESGEGQVEFSEQHQSYTTKSSGIVMISPPIHTTRQPTDYSVDSSLPPSLSPSQSPLSGSPTSSPVEWTKPPSLLPPQPQEGTPHILVVTHSGFIKELLNYLTKFFTPAPQTKQIYHTAIFSFEILSAQQAKPLLISDVQHLQGLGKAYAEKFGFKKKK